MHHLVGRAHPAGAHHDAVNLTWKVLGSCISGGIWCWMTQTWHLLSINSSTTRSVGIVMGCLGIGNMFQSNQAFVQVQAVTGGSDGALAGWG